MTDHTIPADMLRAAKRWLLELDEAIADGSPLVDGTVEVADIIRSLPDPEPTPEEDFEEANRWADDVLAGIVRPERTDMHAVARTVKRVKLPAFDNESGDAMTWADNMPAVTRTFKRLTLLGQLADDGVTDAIIHCPECTCGDTHPDALHTVGDYASAPAGTIIHDGDHVYHRWYATLGDDSDWHVVTRSGRRPRATSAAMPGTFGVGHVLQWGDK